MFAGFLLWDQLSGVFKDGSKLVPLQSELASAESYVMAGMIVSGYVFNWLQPFV